MSSVRHGDVRILIGTAITMFKEWECWTADKGENKRSNLRGKKIRTNRVSTGGCGNFELSCIATLLNRHNTNIQACGFLQIIRVYAIHECTWHWRWKKEHKDFLQY
jgi:hypothetical protein